jgi:hypothetical protein
VLLAEELLLLCLDPQRGRPGNGSEAPMTPCLAGALVAELALLGAVELEGMRFALRPAAVPAGLLQEAAEVLRTGGGRRGADQLRRLDRRLHRVWKRVVDGLVDQGVLGRDPRGPLQVTAHPVLRPELRDEVLRRVRAAAASDGPIEPRTAVLLSLTGPARLLEVVADKPHRHAKARIKQAADSTPVSAAVRAVITEAAAAAASTAVIASTAASS